MGTFIGFFDIIGTIAFSVSGAMVGIRKEMDLFGVTVLGVVTAVGGGMLRDVILGINPPRMFTNYTDVAIAALTAVIAFTIIYFAHRNVREYINFHVTYSFVLFAMDTLGLAMFTVIGIEVALEKQPEAGSFLLVFVGTITGVGGGLLRDMMSGNIPYIFQKHIYATACILGAIVCVTLYRRFSVPMSPAMMAGAATVLLIRVLAARLRWNLPVIKMSGL